MRYQRRGAESSFSALLPRGSTPFDGALFALVPVVPPTAAAAALSDVEVTTVASAPTNVAFGAGSQTIVLDRSWKPLRAMKLSSSAHAVTAIAWVSLDTLACGYEDGSIALWSPGSKDPLLREFRAHVSAVVQIVALRGGDPSSGAIELLALDRGGCMFVHRIARSMWSKTKLSAKIATTGAGVALFGVPALDVHRIAALALRSDYSAALIAPRVPNVAAPAAIIVIALNPPAPPRRLELPSFAHSLPINQHEGLVVMPQPCIVWIQDDDGEDGSNGGAKIVAAYGGEVRCWAPVEPRRLKTGVDSSSPLWAGVCAVATLAIAAYPRRRVALLDAAACVHVRSVQSGALLSSLSLNAGTSTIALVLSSQIWSERGSARIPSLRGIREASPAAIRDAHVQAGRWIAALSVEVERQKINRSSGTTTAVANGGGGGGGGGSGSSARGGEAAGIGRARTESSAALGLLKTYLDAALLAAATTSEKEKAAAAALESAADCDVPRVSVSGGRYRAAALTACAFSALVDQGRSLTTVLQLFEAHGERATLARALRDSLLEIAANESKYTAGVSGGITCVYLTPALLGALLSETDDATGDSFAGGDLLPLARDVVRFRDPEAAAQLLVSHGLLSAAAAILVGKAGGALSLLRMIESSMDVKRASEAQLDLVAETVERGIFSARSAAECAVLLAHLCNVSGKTKNGGVLDWLLRFRSERVVIIVLRAFAASQLRRASAVELTRAVVLQAVQSLSSIEAGAIIAATLPSVGDVDAAAVIVNFASTLDCILAASASTSVDAAIRCALESAAGNGNGEEEREVVLERLATLTSVVGAEMLISALVPNLFSASALCAAPQLASMPELRLACVELALRSEVSDSDAASSTPAVARLRFQLQRTQLELVAELDPVALLEIENEVSVFKSVLRAVAVRRRQSLLPMNATTTSMMMTSSSSSSFSSLSSSTAASAAAIAALSWKAEAWDASARGIVKALRIALLKSDAYGIASDESWELVRLGVAIADADGAPDALLCSQRLWLDMTSAIVDSIMMITSSSSSSTKQTKKRDDTSLENNLTAFLLSAVGSRPAVLRTCLAVLLDAQQKTEQGGGRVKQQLKEEEGGEGGGVEVEESESESESESETRKQQLAPRFAFPTSQLQRIVAKSLATFEVDNRLQVAAARACIAAEQRGVRTVLRADAGGESGDALASSAQIKLSKLPSKDWEVAGGRGGRSSGGRSSGGGAGRGIVVLGGDEQSLQQIPLYLRKETPRMLSTRAREIATNPVHSSVAIFPLPLEAAASRG